MAERGVDNIAGTSNKHVGARSRSNGFGIPSVRPHLAHHNPPARIMIPSRSAPNLRETSNGNKTSCSVYSYLQTQSGLKFAPPSTRSSPARDEDSPPPTPPVRDSSSLKSVKYGPGHEKFPSWPVPATAEAPQALRNHNGGSHRSKSWTDHTNYPKEKVVAYTRPYMKRQHSICTQQKLKTVMEKCEKIPPETYETRYDRINERVYLPHVNHDGKSIGDMDYIVPSPPERDLPGKSELIQADLEVYARTYQEPNHGHLTESGLEEFMKYTRSYDDSFFSSLSSKHESGMLTHMHQKQISYAQSEGYHSYVSSTDSTSTPFLDRLRRDSEAVLPRPMSSNTWDDLSHEEANVRLEGRDSVVTTSSGSASSSETLKWHGSMSDVSVTSHSSSHIANGSSSSKQLIVHSARVQTPQRHHSESVLYMTSERDCSGNWKYRENKNNSANKLKLFPISTYTVQETEKPNQNVTGISSSNRLPLTLQSALSVADRISELEKQQKYSYLDPEKKHKIPDPTLKAIQKKALLSFYERHNKPANNPWRSEPQLNPLTQVGVSQPPPKAKVQMPSRRASSASDYASVNSSKRSSLASNTDNHSQTMPRHQHSNSCGSLSTDSLGPMIVGPSISVDDWVPEKPPERPPKNPYLRTAFPDLFQEQRVPSPDLPLPSPPTIMDDEVFNNDEPLPPPPPELDVKWPQEFNERCKENICGGQMIAAPQVHKSNSKNQMKFMAQSVGLPEQNFKNTYSSMDPSNLVSYHHDNTKQSDKPAKLDILGFPNQRGYQERSSARYPIAPKITPGVATSQKVIRISEQYRPEPLRPHNRDGNKNPSTSLIPSTKSQRASIAESSPKESPPPLKPRQMRVNQSMRVRGSNDHRMMAEMKSPSPGKDMPRERSSSM